MEDPKSSFDTKNEPKYSNETEAKSEVKKAILPSRGSQYIVREARLVSNKNFFYGIIRQQFNPKIESVLKVNE